MLFHGRLSPTDGYATLNATTLDLVVPRPEIRLTLSEPVWSARIELAYPSEDVEVLDTFEPIWMAEYGERTPANHRATAWHDDGTEDLLVVNAAAQRSPLTRVSVVFELDNWRPLRSRKATSALRSCRLRTRTASR